MLMPGNCHANFLIGLVGLIIFAHIMIGLPVVHFASLLLLLFLYPAGDNSELNHTTGKSQGFLGVAGGGYKGTGFPFIKDV